ncbi:MAG: hypothetical protein OEW64_07255 [Gammaproteobacteria bacterium]|nr:hypothetical protein [Gammaproteobacteria bacterium]MDH5303879.1 hypothetical protein [Gammaproteobacteria bacterium]MDH5321482.1 hypothetical protein [Gammaproteobacteria bacterium]
MTNRHWRELLEIVGVVSIVAALLLLAAEVRQSNRIAAAQTAMHIAIAYDALHLERASNPEFAKLFPKLEAPEAHLTTATETSQIRGIARHYFSILWAVQSAYDNGLLGRETLEAYVSGLAHTLDTWPGIRPYYVEMFQGMTSVQDAEVYAPIAAYIAQQDNKESTTTN